MTTKLEFTDRLLPNQDILKERFNGSPGDYYRQLFELISDVSGLEKPEKEFKLSLSDQFSIEEMGSDPINLRLYEMLLHMIGAKHVLEVGTFIGVSTMSFARAIPDGGRVLTIEKYSHFAAIARENFVLNGFDHKIDLREGDARDIIKGLSPESLFDFIFIDGDKENYPLYFSLLKPHLRKGGLIVIDDVFFHGDALNEKPNTSKGRGVKDVLDLAKKSDGFVKIVLPLCNGVMFLLKV